MIIVQQQRSVRRYRSSQPRRSRPKLSREPNGSPAQILAATLRLTAETNGLSRALPDVARLVVMPRMKPVLFGLIAGMAAALALGRLITSQLYHVSAHNPLLLLATAAILALAALLACLLPARRATLLNPVQALRAD